MICMDKGKEWWIWMKGRNIVKIKIKLMVRYIIMDHKRILFEALRSIADYFVMYKFSLMSILSTSTLNWHQIWSRVLLIFYFHWDEQ